MCSQMGTLAVYGLNKHFILQPAIVGKSIECECRSSI